MDARRTPWGRIDYRTCIRRRPAMKKNPVGLQTGLRALLACGMRGKTESQTAVMTSISFGGLRETNNRVRRLASSQIAKGAA